MKATKQALSELKKLAASAVDNLYRRIELAVQVLGDLDWIATEHGGSDLMAQDALQSEFFRDLGGFISLGKLCAMYRAVPAGEWKACRYDVAAVEAVYDGLAETEKKEVGKRTAWKAIAEERAEQLDEQTAELLRLRSEVEKLRDENARLHGRIEQLEKLLDRDPAAV